DATTDVEEIHRGLKHLERELSDEIDERPEADLESDRLTMPPTVFIVDDDNVARRLLSSILDNDWCRVEVAASADEAYERLHFVRPDVILCDLIMHGMNGDEFCRRLKSDVSWQYVPVIAITRVDNSVAIAAMLDAGADDVVVKPVKARE